MTNNQQRQKSKNTYTQCVNNSRPCRHFQSHSWKLHRRSSPPTTSLHTDSISLFWTLKNKSPQVKLERKNRAFLQVEQTPNHWHSTKWEKLGYQDWVWIMQMRSCFKTCSYIPDAWEWQHLVDTWCKYHSATVHVLCSPVSAYNSDSPEKETCLCIQKKTQYGEEQTAFVSKNVHWQQQALYIEECHCSNLAQR